MDGLEALKKRYSFNKGSYKYIPAGGEILKYIGQPMIFVDFKKDENGDWQSTYETAIVESISDFDPMTMTYLCKYKLADNEPKEIRIIPEGFSWGDPEETGEMKRFVPTSLHYQLQEDELFFKRLEDLWNERQTIDLDSLKTLSESKEQEKTLKYTHQIGALIKTADDGKFMWVRLWKLGLTHRNGEYYNLSFGDERNRWTVTIKKSDTEYELKDIGTFKLIDLQG